MLKVPYTFLDVSKKRHLKLKPLNKNNAEIMGTVTLRAEATCSRL